MFLLITYDINTVTPSGKRRLSKLAKECCNYGQRVQNSVFEFDIDNAKYIEVREKMLKIIDSEHDSLRVYHLGSNYQQKTEQYGRNTSYDPEGELIF